jgi:hypothetical protein
MSHSRKTISMFSREFRKTFNTNKYGTLTRRVDEMYSHQPHFSVMNTKWGRGIFTVFFGCCCLVAYVDSGYFHEMIGHLEYLPQDDLTLEVLSGEEKELNKQILHREHDEHKLENFMKYFRDYQTK